MLSPSRPSDPPKNLPRPRVPLWLLRLIFTLGAPLAFFLLLEGILRLAHFGTNPEFFIPDVDKPGFYCANPTFTELFLPAHFGIRPLNFRLKQHKEANSVRVFVLGESAAQGTPEPAFGFASQLQAQLTAHYPGKKIEVFNLGITAINSHVVYEIARQLPAFEPDLFIVYMGNNEVIGPYGPGSAYGNTMPPLWAIRASVWARGSRTGQLLLQLISRFGRSGAKTVEWRGMETFAQHTVRGDDLRLAAVYGNFERNLHDIVALATAAGSKTVLSTVVANLKDSSPFVSLHRTNLTATELAAWKTTFDAGLLAWHLQENEKSLTHFTEALRLDPEYADTYFMLGRLDAARGDVATARQHFLAALHWDALRFRPDTPLNDIIRRISREAGPAVFLVDAARAMGADPASLKPLCGHDLLFEHVHFNWEGNFRLGSLLAEACAKFIPGNTQTDWLNSTQCADALGYTDYGRLTMLGTIAELTGKPPFTNQLTFGDYQTELKHDSSQLHTAVMNHEGLLAAEAKIARAVERDPANPNLLIRLENIEFDLRNLDHALELVDRAMLLQPRSAVLITQKANLLQIFNRPNEAEEMLLNSTKTDPYYFPAWQVLVGIWGKTGQIAKGKRTLESLLEKMPSNNYLRMAYATLLMHGREANAAEQQWRDILRDDPSNTAALEQLVRLYQQTDRAADAEILMLTAAKFQPRNADNNSRLAQLYAAKGDTENMVIYLQALTEGGPADASLLLELAQRLIDLRREPEALVYARRGKKAATAESNTELIQAADDLLKRLEPLVK